MVEACRRDPGSLGFVSAIGWYLTKHSLGCYSTTPPRDGFGRVDPAQTQRSVDAGPRRGVAGRHTGPARVEATAVVVERDGTPSLGIVAARTPDGRRALANTRDVDTLRDMTATAWEGRSVRLRAEDGTNQLG